MQKKTFQLAMQYCCTRSTRHMLVVLLGLQSLALFGGIIPSVNQVYVKPVCYYYYFFCYMNCTVVFTVYVL